MKHLYLFNEGSRAAIYGIGTYIRQMIVSFLRPAGYKVECGGLEF